MLDCALDEADPLTAVRSTGWPQIEPPLTVKKMPPAALPPAARAASVQVAPVAVGWQFQCAWPANKLSEASPPPPPPPPPPFIEAPAGSVIVTVTWPAAAEPMLSTWNETQPPPCDPFQLFALTVDASRTVPDPWLACWFVTGGVEIRTGLGTAEGDLLCGDFDAVGDGNWVGVVAPGGDAAAS